MTANQQILLTVRTEDDDKELNRTVTIVIITGQSESKTSAALAVVPRSSY